VSSRISSSLISTLITGSGLAAFWSGVLEFRPSLALKRLVAGRAKTLARPEKMPHYKEVTKIN
jgi:hypothetical protein